MAKAWKKEDVTYLRRYAKSRTASELLKRFGCEEAQLLEKLQELELVTKDGRGHEAPFTDPALEVYEQALQALHKGKLAEAGKHFERVVAEADTADLKSRALVFLEVVKARLPAGADSSADDPYLEAVVAKNTGDLAAAMALCNRGGRRSKDERFAYLAASVQALEGNLDDAMELLQLAIELNPKNRVHAYHDPDFEPLRGEAEFGRLFETA